MADESPRWMVFDGKDTLGPFSDEDVIEVIHKGLPTEIMVKREGEAEWKPLASYPRFALAVEKAKKDRPAPKPTRPLWVRAAWGVGGLAGLFLANTYLFGVGAKVTASCSAMGLGSASCLFANEGYLPGAGCVVIRLMRVDNREELDSIPICSGVLWPLASGSVSVPMAFPRSPASHCNGERGSAWTDNCVFGVLPK